MISTCAQNDPTQTLQDLIFIGKHKLKSTFLFLHLGPLFLHFFICWVPLWALLAHLGSHVAPLRPPLGSPWRSLGASWLPLEYILALWGPPWPSQNLLWLPLRSPLASSGFHWVSPASFWEPMGNFDYMFGPSWCMLVSVGPILVSICL